MSDSFASKNTLKIDNQTYTIFRLAAVYKKYPQAERLPFSLKILLENLLRREDGLTVRAEDIAALAQWDAKAEPSQRDRLHAGPRAAAGLHRRAGGRRSGGHARRHEARWAAIRPRSIRCSRSSWSSIIRCRSTTSARPTRSSTTPTWSSSATRNATSSCAGARTPCATSGGAAGDRHRPSGQSRIPGPRRLLSTKASTPALYPDTLVGTDSHTTMINGLGVLGWGVGGIEAEAAMLGQPVSMLIPQVVGFKLFGQLPEGATATDLVLTVTQMLRKKGVVGKFVEFFGPGLASLPLADRATIANMAPEYGATCGIFPVDEETLDLPAPHGPARGADSPGRSVLQGTGAVPHRNDAGSRPTPIRWSWTWARSSRRWRGRAGRRIACRLSEVKKSFFDALPNLQVKKQDAEPAQDRVARRCRRPVGEPHAAELRLPAQHGSVVIAAITSCTNTSNPSVHARRRAAGQEGGRARACKPSRGSRPAWPPAREAVTDYLVQAGLLRSLEQLRFFLVGYGCTTCIGNSGPLPAEISKAIAETTWSWPACCPAIATSRAGFIPRCGPTTWPRRRWSSPTPWPAGSTSTSPTEPLGKDATGQAGLPQGHLADAARSAATRCGNAVKPETFKRIYDDVFHGRRALAAACAVPAGDLFAWEPESTYVKHPPYFENMPPQPGAIARHSRGPRPGRAGRQHHHRPHFAGRVDQEGQPRRQVPDRPTACSRPTSTATAPAAAITKS